MEVPTELKFISPYIQRAQELANREPIVSYYGKYSVCVLGSSVYSSLSLSAQYYAAKLAMAKGPRTKETKEYLFRLLDTLEAVK